MSPKANADHLLITMRLFVKYYIKYSIHGMVFPESTCNKKSKNSFSNDVVREGVFGLD
jgi:hypothetical protein